MDKRIKEITAELDSQGNEINEDYIIWNAKQFKELANSINGVILELAHLSIEEIRNLINNNFVNFEKVYGGLEDFERYVPLMKSILISKYNI
jgi:hypothetical protein